MSSKPWESLRFVSKVEIVPGPGQKEVHARYEEDYEYEHYNSSFGSPARLISRDRTIHLSGETLNLHYDYPDNFKKLVAFYHGDYQNAYDVYQTLQKPVPANWETCNKDGEHDCDC